MKHLLTACALLGTVVGLQAQTSQVQFTEFDLDNGLHVILHEDHSTPIVVVSVLYHVGSKDENPERTGFAHFFEHLLFEGSQNIKRGEFDKYIQGAGGYNNANTSQDRTFYYEVIASNQLELGLWLESERMLHAKVEDEGIETQREVVKEEKRQRMDNQEYGSFLNEIFSRAYKVHPYRWIPIGSMEHLNAAKKEEFMQFYKTYYVPENATLSIAGDLTIAETKVLVEKYFKDIPRGGKEIPRVTAVEPQQTVEIRDSIVDSLASLPAIIQAYHIPAQNSDDAYAVEMLSMILSGGESSRMSKNIVDQQEKALYVGAFPFALENPGLFITLGIVNGDVTLADLESAMDAEVNKVQNELITESEFQKLRNQIESDFYNQQSTMEGIAEALANYHTYYGSANLINTEIDRYMKVTREDIQRVAKKYLIPTNRVVLYYVPVSKEEE